MSERQETIEDIIAEARDKYTVHECNQCAWRKCCSKGFGSEECGKRRESIWLKLGIEDGYFTQLLDRLEAANKREVGNRAALREALERLREWAALDLNENTYIEQKSGNYLKLIKGVLKIANAALAAPQRNCDKYATADEALKAHEQMFNDSNFANGECKLGCPECDNPRVGCKIAWLFGPATEKEGGAK